MKIQVLEPHGFCAGVKGALERACKYPEAWCLHEIVHNELVVEKLKSRGMKFVESIDRIPSGETVIFSAHGVSPLVREEARKRNLKIVDATCPFVAKVHKDAKSFSDQGLEVVVVGNKGHAEVKGIVGEVPRAWVYPDLPPKGRKIGVVSQTTMNSDEVAEIVEKLRKDYEVVESAKVCNATKARQDAVKAFEGDLLLVLGSANSSNTKRLAEVARCKAIVAGTRKELEKIDVDGVELLGLTAGASTPEEFLVEALEFLKNKSTGKE